MHLHHVASALIAFALTGCATIIHGTQQTVEITSTPSGATATITPGEKTIITPGAATLDRSGAYVVRCTLDGYRPTTGYIDHDVSAARWGNLALGGIIGLLVDHGNGAAYELTPDPLDVRLEPVGEAGSGTRPTSSGN